MHLIEEVEVVVFLGDDEVHVDAVGALTGQVDGRHVEGGLVYLDGSVGSLVE